MAGKKIKKPQEGAFKSFEAAIRFSNPLAIYTVSFFALIWDQRTNCSQADRDVGIVNELLKENGGFSSSIKELTDVKTPVRRRRRQ